MPNKLVTEFVSFLSKSKDFPYDFLKNKAVSEFFEKNPQEANVDNFSFIMRNCFMPFNYSNIIKLIKIHGFKDKDLLEIMQRVYNFGYDHGKTGFIRRSIDEGLISDRSKESLIDISLELSDDDAFEILKLFKEKFLQHDSEFLMQSWVKRMLLKHQELSISLARISLDKDSINFDYLKKFDSELSLSEFKNTLELFCYCQIYKINISSILTREATLAVKSAFIMQNGMRISHANLLTLSQFSDCETSSFLDVRLLTDYFADIVKSFESSHKEFAKINFDDFDYRAYCAEHEYEDYKQSLNKALAKLYIERNSENAKEFLRLLIPSHEGDALINDSQYGLATSFLEKNVDLLCAFFTQPNNLQLFISRIASQSDGCIANIGNQVRIALYQSLFQEQKLQILFNIFVEEIYLPIIDQERSRDVIHAYENPLKNANINEYKFYAKSFLGSVISRFSGVSPFVNKWEFLRKEIGDDMVTKLLELSPKDSEDIAQDIAVYLVVKDIGEIINSKEIGDFKERCNKIFEKLAEIEIKKYESEHMPPALVSLKTSANSAFKPFKGNMLASLPQLDLASK